MNDLENRIYRDASKIASEITPADIPPLGLTHHRISGAGSRAGAGRGAAQWTGVASRSHGRRVAAALAAAASVAVLASVLAIAGHGPAGHAPVTSPTAARERHAHHTVPQPGTEPLDSYFPASGASYTAGLAFAWLQAKTTAGDIDPCLAAAGFPQPPFRGSVRLYQMSFPSQQFPDLAELAAHPGTHFFTGQYPMVHNPTPARMKRFDRAQARCTTRFAGSVTRVDQAAAHLQTTWFGIIAAVESSPQVSATQPGLAKCLEAHGVPASYATMTTHASNPLFYGFDSWSDSINQAAASTRELAANQRKEARVFLACAGPVATVVDKLQLSRRAAFFSEHRKQIARIIKLAGEMR